jgi:hypothetical protein
MPVEIFDANGRILQCFPALTGRRDAWAMA